MISICHSYFISISRKHYPTGRDAEISNLLAPHWLTRTSTLAMTLTLTDGVRPPFPRHRPTCDSRYLTIVRSIYNIIYSWPSSLEIVQFWFHESRGPCTLNGLKTAIYSTWVHVDNQNNTLCDSNFYKWVFSPVVVSQPNWVAAKLLEQRRLLTSLMLNVC